MKHKTVPAWVVLVSFGFIIAAAVTLVILLTPSSAKTAPGGSTAYPSQDCCVPSTDLRGTWTYKISNGSTFTADISDKTIKIYMNSKNGTSMLYWQGTFEFYKPVGSVINSTVDDDAEMLSKSTSKNFTVGQTTLSFDFTAMGQTVKVDLSRV
jgi:hypothetical protein